MPKKPKSKSRPSKKKHTKKTDTKTTSTKKADTKKTGTKKPSAKKSDTNKPSAKKTDTKTTSTKKADTKTTSTKKADTKKTETKKPSTKKSSAKKADTKKPSAKKSSTKEADTKQSTSQKKNTNKKPTKGKQKTVAFWSHLYTPMQCIIIIVCLAGIYYMVMHYPHRQTQNQISAMLSKVPGYYKQVYGQELSQDLKAQLQKVQPSDKTLQRYHDYFGTDIKKPSDPKQANQSDEEQDESLLHQHYAALSKHPPQHAIRTITTLYEPSDRDIMFQKLLAQYQQRLPLRSIRSAYNDHAASYHGSTPNSVLLAIIGCESGWGNLVGRYPMDFDILSSLATLAHTVPDPQKRLYYHENLLAYLHILMDTNTTQAVDKTLIQQSTFDGGMGIPQFEPNSYIKYAADGDTDTLANIWESMPDAMASVDEYLIKHGWDKQLPWGYFVAIRQDHKPELLKLAQQRSYQSIATWQAQGITLPHQSKPLPTSAMQTQARLLIPKTSSKRSLGFLVTKNYQVLLRWNPSEAEALMIGVISNIMENPSLDYYSFRDADTKLPATTSPPTPRTSQG